MKIASLILAFLTLVVEIVFIVLIAIKCKSMNKSLDNITKRLGCDE